MRVPCVRVDHLLRVTVVGGNEQDVPGLFACLIDRLDSLVRFGDCFYCGVVHASVSYLFTIANRIVEVGGKQERHTISGGAKLHMINSYFPLFDLLCHFLRHAMCRHFRLLVVGRNFGTGDELAVFTIKLLLDATIEEEGYVSVLFGF
jgi:hypothetical protein